MRVDVAAEEPVSGQALEALDAATRAVAGVLSVDRVLQVIVDRVRPLVDARYAALGIVGASGTIERFITSGIDGETRARIGPLPRGHGLLGLIISENRAFRIHDIATDPRRFGFPPHHPEMHSFLGVPVNVKGRSVGNLYLTEKATAAQFSERDERLVEMFALHAGIAIENARLHEQVERLAIVDERERIGKDLHDGIIQSIYAVTLSLEDLPELMSEDRDEAAARVERAIDALHLTIRDIRNFIFGLRPEILEGNTLVGGLLGLAEEFRHNTLIEVDVQGVDESMPEPSPERSVELLAIVREALSNVARHARASQASLALRSDGRELNLVIADNGVGFTGRRPRGRGHEGMANMAARAQRLGGRVVIDSEFGAGTRVMVQVPLEAPARA
jgi:two-component system, NarL family, sensor histidine kinase DevS